MRILATISDMKRVGLVLDLEQGSATPIPVRSEFIDPGLERVLPCRPFGITWSEDELYVSNNRQLLVFDRHFQYLRTLATPLQTNVHQLAYHASRIWAVSPRTNSLIVVDPQANMPGKEFDLLSRQMIPYVPRRAPESDDKHHFNSVLFADGSLFVAAHNFTRPSFIEQYNDHTLVLEHVECEAGSSIHGLALHEGELFWISTETQEIRSSRGYRHPLPRPGYARGFSVTDEYFIVAISDFLTRDKRNGGHSKIQVIDRRTRNVVKEHHFHDTGSINDIRLLDGYDYAHCVPPFLREGSKLPLPNKVVPITSSTSPTLGTASVSDDLTQAELGRLRAEVTKLRAQLTMAEVDARLADRDREYQQRMLSLEKAAVGVAALAEPAEPKFAELINLVKGVVAQVHIQGYAIVPNLLTPKQVERARDGLAPLFARTARMFGQLNRGGLRLPFHIHNVLAKTRAVDELAVNPVLRAIIGGLLGHDFLLHAGAIAMSPDFGCDAQELHRDDGSFALLPRPRMPLVITAAIALDDFTRDNGGTRIVPGSCRWPASRRPTAEEVVHCEMAAGSVLLWDGSIFHGGGANVTKHRTRRTLTLNYIRGWLRTQQNQYLSLPRELVLAMPSELQRDLGYQLSARGLGGCDNQDPLLYLQRMALRGGDGAQPMLGQEEEHAVAAVADRA